MLNAAHAAWQHSQNPGPSCTPFSDHAVPPFFCFLVWPVGWITRSIDMGRYGPNNTANPTSHQALVVIVGDPVLLQVNAHWRYTLLSRVSLVIRSSITPVS